MLNLNNVSRTLFLLVLLSLAIWPPAVWGINAEVFQLGLSTLHNLLLVLLSLPLVLTSGVGEFYKNPVIVGFSVMLFFSFAFASRHPILTPFQSVQSYFAFILGALLFEICKPANLRRAMLNVLPYIALLSIFLGLVFDIVGWYTFYRIDFTGAYRIQGAMGPSQLAMLALNGIYITSLGKRTPRHRTSLYLLNYGIVVFSGTRGALIAASLALVVLVLVQFWKVRRDASGDIRRIVYTVIAGMIVLNALYLPEHYQRWTYSHPSDLEFFSEDSEDAVSPMESLNSSGRFTVWRFFYNEAKENILFGRGIGAGTIANQGQVHRAFQTPHNEYIRLLIDGGYIGLALGVAGYIGVMLILLKGRSLEDKVSILAVFGSFAFLSLVDNTLSTQQYIVLFWMYLALARIGTRACFVLVARWPFIAFYRDDLHPLDPNGTGEWNHRTQRSMQS